MSITTERALVLLALALGPACSASNGSAGSSSSGAPLEVPVVTSGGGSVTGATPSSAPPVISASSQGPGARGPVDGTWQSDHCGHRNYPRVIELGPGMGFRAHDRVSPCPANVACVWSGIVERSGTFALEGADVVLTVVDGADAKAGDPFPAKLSRTGGLAEQAPDGSLCPYHLP